jgi:hypothetical protein
MRPRTSPARAPPLEEGRGLHQCGVSCLVTVGIVDALEVVQVEEHQCERPSVALRTGNFALDPLLEGAMIEQAGQRIAGGLRQQVRTRVGVCDREPGEVREDAEPLFQVRRHVLRGTRDDKQRAPQLPAHADRNCDSARQRKGGGRFQRPRSLWPRWPHAVDACGASSAGHAPDPAGGVQWDQGSDLLAAHAPRANDLGDAVHPEADHGARIDAGDRCCLFRDELVDHLGRPHLRDGHGQVSQRGLLLEQISNARVDGSPPAARGDRCAGCATAHLERLTGRRGGGVPRRPCSCG